MQTHFEVRDLSLLSLRPRSPKNHCPLSHSCISPRDGQMTNALTDCLLSFRLLKVGGLLLVDDMSLPGVFRAVGAFVEALEADDRIEVLNREVRNHRHGRHSSTMVLCIEMYGAMCLFGKTRDSSCQRVDATLIKARVGSATLVPPYASH